MTDPISPPPELVAKLWREASAGRDDAPIGEIFNHGVLLAYAAGADQELEACCLLLDSSEHAATYGCHDGTSLRAARRPRPPSLKERALKALDHICVNHSKATDHECTIRKALEALDD